MALPGSRDAQLTGAVPGPPFLPRGTTRSDLPPLRPYIDGGDTSTRRGEHEQQQQQQGLDQVGVALFRTMNGVIADHNFARFFCKPNLDRVQECLRQRVRRDGGYVIDRQSDENVLLLMRKAYLDSGRGQRPGESLDTINDRVVAEAAAKVLSNLMYASIHTELKDKSFTPLEYGISDMESFRGKTLTARDLYQ